MITSPVRDSILQSILVERQAVNIKNYSFIVAVNKLAEDISGSGMIMTLIII